MEIYKEIQKILKNTKEISYPSIPQLPRNKRYAQYIYNNFAGELGELTAITQYIYEHIELNKQKNLSEILMKIAIEEMKHLDILGEILVNLGEKPYFMNQNKEFWNAKYVKYNIGDLKHMMEINIQGEIAAIQGYQNLIKVTNYLPLRRIYERILIDEKAHKKIFEMIKEDV